MIQRGNTIVSPLFLWEQNLCAHGWVGQAQTNIRILASPKFQYMYFEFSMPTPPKNPKESPRGFLPRPLLRGGEIQNPRRISKTSVSVLRILSPENSFAKPSPHLYSHIPSFPFGKALCFAQRRFSARMSDELFVLKKCSSLVQ